MGKRAKPSVLHEKRAQVLKAMAHPSRLAMLDALADGEVCVCDLHGLVGSDLSTVSKHLAVLREAGLVSDRRQGLQVFYSLRVPCAVSFFGCIDKVIAAGPQTGPRRVAAGDRDRGEATWTSRCWVRAARSARSSTPRSRR